MKKLNKKGFTLIELLVVIVILIVIMKQKVFYGNPTKIVKLVVVVVLELVAL